MAPERSMSHRLRSRFPNIIPNMKRRSTCSFSAVRISLLTRERVILIGLAGYLTLVPVNWCKFGFLRTGYPD